MILSKLQTRVSEKVDGRTFTISQISAWADDLRKSVSMDFPIAGFHGLYFLYKIATVKGGSIISSGSYALPDDFIDDLWVFYNGKLLTKADDANMVVSSYYGQSGIPQWYSPMGQTFELIPKANEVGIEIKLFYNGLPANPAEDPNFEDFFMRVFPNLHVYGVAEMACESVGRDGLADRYGQKLTQEKVLLQINNRQHYLKHAKLRLQNWEEFQEQIRHVFPQFDEQ